MSFKNVKVELLKSFLKWFQSILMLNLSILSWVMSSQSVDLFEFKVFHLYLSTATFEIKGRKARKINRDH